MHSNVKLESTNLWTVGVPVAIGNAKGYLPLRDHVPWSVCCSEWKTQYCEGTEIKNVAEIWTFGLDGEHSKCIPNFSRLISWKITW